MAIARVFVFLEHIAHDEMRKGNGGEGAKQRCTDEGIDDLVDRATCGAVGAGPVVGFDPKVWSLGGRIGRFCDPSVAERQPRDSGEECSMSDESRSFCEYSADATSAHGG